MSAPRAAAQLFRIADATRSFVPPATTRAGTAQRAVPTIALHIPMGEGRGEGQYFSEFETAFARVLTRCRRSLRNRRGPAGRTRSQCLHDAAPLWSGVR